MTHFSIHPRLAPLSDLLTEARTSRDGKHTMRWQEIEHTRGVPAIINTTGELAFVLDGDRIASESEWWREVCRLTANAYRRKLPRENTRKWASYMKRFIWCVENDLNPDQRLPKVDAILLKLAA